MRIAYTQARQDRTRKEKLQEKGLWIGREMDELHEREADDEKEEDVPLKRLRNKARVVPKSSSRGSDQAEEGEKEEGEAAARRRRSLGASAAQRERKIEEKRPIEVGRKRVEEKRSEKEGGARREEETEGGKKIREGDRAPRVIRTKEKGLIGDREGMDRERGEEEVRIKGGKGVEVGVEKRKVERGELSQLREEVEEGQMSKEEKAQREKKRKGWRNYMIRMLQNNELPVNSTWDVRFERMLLSELVVSSKHSDNLQKMMGLHDMLDEKCTKLFEDYAEIARKMGEMEGGGGIKKIGEDLVTWIQLRKKEEERDTQVAKLIEDMEGVKNEVEELKKGKAKLLKQVDTLKASLTMKGKELEDEAAARGRVEKKVEGLCFEVSMQGLDLDEEIYERKKLGQDLEKRWEEILKGMKELKLSHQERGDEATKVVE
ncbi:hypothetical protein CBR_g27864 [Chara braunii]|uniref:Uncharacterized protein n=1 Tax=Chara braunii TaxID=69332 RepID=A0A388L8P0_CHABU|nr:hypothetical protein CBR_g27864 [Chara braunii]|eukprot:GBG78638.1 hypothetical protein CBR_g27864 [Chara braunii]